MVGAVGIEPTTPSMSPKCSPTELRALAIGAAFGRCPTGTPFLTRVAVLCKRAGADFGESLPDLVMCRPPARLDLQKRHLLLPLLPIGGVKPATSLVGEKSKCRFGIYLVEIRPCGRANAGLTN